MPKEIYNDNFSSMGTRFGMVLPGISGSLGLVISALIKEELERVESKISRFIPTSRISYLNRFASKYPVEVDDELWRLLKECRGYYSSLFGAFDITLKSLADYWNSSGSDGENAKDNKAGIEILLKSVGMDKIEFIEGNHSVFFKSGEIEIDLGSIGKGLAIKNIKEILLRNGIVNAFISFGESSILAIGSHPNGEHWKVGIPNPLNKKENIYTLDISNSSISTSGNTLNNRIQGRVNIINPFTGFPVTENKTILVAGENPVLAEVLSTSFMILDDDRIITILKNYPDVNAVKILYGKKGNSEVTEFREKILS